MLTIQDGEKFATKLENEIESIGIEFMVAYPALHRDIRNTTGAIEDLHTAIRKGMRYILELEGLTYD